MLVVADLRLRMVPPEMLPGSRSDRILSIVGEDITVVLFHSPALLPYPIPGAHSGPYRVRLLTAIRVVRDATLLRHRGHAEPRVPPPGSVLPSHPSSGSGPRTAVEAPERTVQQRVRPHNTAGMQGATDPVVLQRQRAPRTAIHPPRILTVRAEAGVENPAEPVVPASRGYATSGFLRCPN